METTINLNKFKLNDFISAIEAFSSDMSGGQDPRALICVVEENGTAPGFGEVESERNIIDDINKEKTVVFPFSGPGCDEYIDCADGARIILEKEVDEDGCIIVESPLGETDIAGVLLQKNGEEIIIKSGILYGGGCMCPPSFEVVETEEFDQKISVYIKKFIM